MSYATSNKKARSAFFHRSLVDIHQEFASRMGCPLKKETDIEVSVKCLQEKSVSDLMNGLKIFDQCNSKYLLSYFFLRLILFFLNKCYLDILGLCPLGSNYNFLWLKTKKIKLTETFTTGWNPCLILHS